MKIVKVCKELECDNKTITANGHSFCCQKGFEKSLEGFREYLKIADKNENGEKNNSRL